MADLPTNYLDDILAQSMNGKRKFRITRPDGTFEEVIIEDVSEYSQTGSTFGAGDINRTNQAVNEKFDSGDVVDPMLTTEEGFAADAYKTKLQFDEQNKNFTWKLAGSASRDNLVSLSGISYEEVLIYVTNDSDGDGKAGWYDTSLVVPKVALTNRQIINMPAYNHNEADHLYCVCWYGNQAIGIYVHAAGDTSVLDKSTLYVYYR